MADIATLAGTLGAAKWHLDPGSSKIEFSVPHFYGLMKVKGRFERYSATFELGVEPAITLTVEAASIDTGNKKRDEHLRSKDFFDVSEHPTLGFSSTRAELQGDTLQVSGTLTALGRSVPIELPLQIVPDGNGYAVTGSLAIDQRRLGLTWSPAGITRTPTTVSLRGRLLR
jgi:polyisoprenoid-binding protein YceI